MMSSELLDNSVEYDENIFEYLKVKDEKEEVLPELVESTREEELFTVHKQVNESYILEKLKKDGSYIQFVENPTEKMKTIAIKQNVNYELVESTREEDLFTVLKKVNESYILEILKKDGVFIRYINNPTEKNENSSY